MNNANHVLSGGEFPAAVAGPSTSRTQQPQSQLNNMLGSADVVKWTKDILKFNVCRICVTYHDSGPELVSIFTQRPNEKESFADLINKYLPIQVSERDTLPCVVCRACACKLTDWHGMVRACLDSAQLLAAQADRIATGRSYILTPERNDNPVRTQFVHLVDLTDETDDEADEADERPSSTASVAVSLAHTTTTTPVC